MNDLNKLLAKPKEVVIDGEKFVLNPLTVKNLDLIKQLENDKTSSSSMKEIIKLAVPNSTDELVEGISLGSFKKLSEAIIEINGLGGKEKNLDAKE